MPQWRPDQSFYPSPKMAMEAAPEKTAYVSMLNPRENGSDAIGVLDVDPASGRYGQLIAQVDMPHPETSCTISDGMPAVRVFALTRLTRTWSGDIWSCRVYAPHGPTFSTPSLIRGIHASPK